MTEIKQIDVIPGNRVAKLVLSFPREPWFASTSGSAWNSLPVNSILEVVRIDEIPAYGGTVVQLKDQDGRIMLIPQSWLTTQHFRVLTPLTGQQMPLFIEQPTRH